MPDENQTIAGDGQAGQASQNAVIQPGDDFVLDFGDGENNDAVKVDTTSIDTDDVKSTLDNKENEDEKQENKPELELDQKDGEEESPLNQEKVQEQGFSQEETQEQGDFDITLGEDDTGVSIQNSKDVDKTEETVNENISESIPGNRDVNMEPSLDIDVEPKDTKEIQDINDNVIDETEKNVSEMVDSETPQQTVEVELKDNADNTNNLQENIELKEDNSEESYLNNSELFSDGQVEAENMSELNENTLGTDRAIGENTEEFKEGDEIQTVQEGQVLEYGDQNIEADIKDNQITYDLPNSTQESNEAQNNIFMEGEQTEESEILDKDIQENKLEEDNEESSEINLSRESFNDSNDKSEDSNHYNLNENNNETQEFTLDLSGSTGGEGESSIELQEPEPEEGVSNQDESNGFLLDNYNDMANMPEIHEESEVINNIQEGNEGDKQPELTQYYNEDNTVNEETDSGFKLDLGNISADNIAEDKQSEPVNMSSEENSNDKFWVNQEESKEDLLDNNAYEDTTSSVYGQNNTDKETVSNQLSEDSQVVTENTIVDSVAITPNEKEEDIAGSIGVSGFADKLKEIGTAKTNSSVEQIEHKEVQSTLSLDQILDSELISNPQLANNSTAVPVNTPVNSGLFSNKKVVGIIAGVGVFLMLGFVVALAFPAGNNKDRNSGEVVVENNTGYDEAIDGHGSAPLDPTITDTGSSIDDTYVDPYTSDSEDSTMGTGGKPTSTVYFPIAEDPSETEYEQPILEPEPYTCIDCGTSEIEQENPFEEEKEISVDKIRADIFSFKSQGEIYHSAGQSTSDGQLMKYASQMIYLCDNYEAQIDSGEGIDEESYLSFKSNISGVLGKIDQYINGGDETIVVQNLEDKSYFEGKDELKQYIYNNR